MAPGALGGSSAHVIIGGVFFWISLESTPHAHPNAFTPCRVVAFTAQVYRFDITLKSCNYHSPQFLQFRCLYCPFRTALVMWRLQLDSEDSTLSKLLTSLHQHMREMRRRIDNSSQSGTILRAAARHSYLSSLGPHKPYSLKLDPMSLLISPDHQFSRATTLPRSHTHRAYPGLYCVASLWHLESREKICRRFNKDFSISAIHWDYSSHYCPTHKSWSGKSNKTYILSNPTSAPQI